MKDEIKDAIEWIENLRDGWDDSSNIKYCNMAIETLKEKQIDTVKECEDIYDIDENSLYESCVIKTDLMREATDKERESTKNYIDSISTPTGVHFYEIDESIYRDCVSREVVKELFCDSIEKKLTPIDFLYRLNNLPSIKPQIQYSDDYISREELLKHQMILIDDDGLMHKVVLVDSIKKAPSVYPNK